MQIGYLFYDCLKFSQQIKTLKLSPKIMQLEGEALKIALEQPLGWEQKLFGQVFASELRKSKDLKRDLIYGISYGNIRKLSNVDEINNWIDLKLNEILAAPTHLNSLFYEAIPKAMGKPGEPGDFDYLIYVAEKMGGVYESIIKWGLDIKAVIVIEDWKKAIQLLSKIPDTFLSDLENFCEEYNQRMNQIPVTKELYEKEKTILNLDVTLTLNPPDLNDFWHEIGRLRNKYGL